MMTSGDEYNSESTAPLEDSPLILDVRSGQTGDVSDWVARFRTVWGEGQTSLEPMLALLSDDIVLRGPVTPPVTRSKAEARSGFARAFRAMPDFRADIHRYAISGDALFVEMTFKATIGGRKIQWPNVDRFIFKRGVAVERVAHFDATRLRKAFLRNPKGMKQLWTLRRG